MPVLAPPLAAVIGIWAAVLGPWAIVPFFSRAPVGGAVRRLPVWAGIAALEIAALATGQALLVVMPAALATGVASIEVAGLTGASAWSVAGCALGLLIGMAGIHWPPALLAAPAVAVWLLTRPAGGRTLFPLAAGTLFPLLLAPFWMTWRNGAALPLMIATLVLVHMADISAGFAGKLGGPKVFPRLSPNKTWSGLAGSAVAVAALAAWLLPKAADVGPAGAALLGLMIWGTSVVGDLAASKIKRLVGAKDFSAVLGAHGGVADRMDSLVVTLPLMAILAPSLLG